MIGHRDPIMRDIENAAKIGHFDRRDAEGPSVLELTTVFQLLADTEKMSPERRRLYLANIGRIWGERALLSGGKRSKKSRLWLSR